MFWDQEPSTYKEQIRKKEYQLVYRILETVEDSIHKRTWHKIETTWALWKMIREDTKARGANWDTIKENNGPNFVWVTDHYLTLLHIKGAEHEIN